MAGAGAAPGGEGLTLRDLERCFSGAVPAVIATRSGAGVPNVTYLSRAHVLDGERLALSNQFFSKTSRNLAEHPRASLLLVDPQTHDEYRLAIAYERTERRGRVFDRLRDDVDAIAALTGMEGVFRLRAADIYRVLTVEEVPSRQTAAGGEARPEGALEAVPVPDAVSVAMLAERISRCGDLDTLVRVTVDGLAQLLSFEHSSLAMLDEDGARLFTIASHGYEAEGVSSEIDLGDGVVGSAASRCEPVRVGNARQMLKYGRAVRESYAASGEVGPGREVPPPRLSGTDSRLAVPALALGQLVGVLVVESTRVAAFSPAHEAALTTVASLVATSIEAVRAEERVTGTAPAPTPLPVRSEATTLVRFFEVDGSTFLDDDYLIKGVAGRILWSLLAQHQRTGRVDFTNKEVRLDPTLELPAFRDNLESRLIMLKRRLEERSAAVRIHKTGRGRFRLEVTGTLRLETGG